MTDRRTYFDRAESWAGDTRAQAARSRRTAWTVAGIAVAVASFEAVALAMLAPLKTVQPITLLVDKQTGYVQALDPLSPKRVMADEALTNSYLAQYVNAREGFDRATVSVDYRRVALWSTGRARSTYLAMMPAANGASPFQRYPSGTTVQVRVKSVSRLNPSTALVRFDTQVAGRAGNGDVPQPWISVIRFRYTDAPMRLEDRLVNPLGFQVTGYRRDAEAPPPPQFISASEAIPKSTGQSGGQIPSARISAAPASHTARTIAPVADRPLQRSDPSLLAGDTQSFGSLQSRRIPLSALPLGSPLSPGGSQFGMGSGAIRP